MEESTMDEKIVIILKVVKFIIELILGGDSKSTAFAKASKEFGISVDEVEAIWNKHGK